MKSGLGTRAAREWPDARRAPGNHVARLVAARVCAADGRTTEAADIRRPVGVELTYDVLESGHVLVPNFHFTNEEGVRVFVLHDTDPEWRRPAAAGRALHEHGVDPGQLPRRRGCSWSPVALSTHDPLAVHCLEEDAVAFQVVDSLDGDTARGDYVGAMPGVVRPMVEWTTRAAGGSAAPKTDELTMLEIST
jgi:lipopolysaccharide transport system ATP-binding protein